MKKADDLSLAKTFEFAKTCYLTKQTTSGEELLVHCKRVATQSEIIAQKLYQDLRVEYVPENIDDTVAAIVHCGLLHDALNVSSCAFENIAEVANVQIAAMVAALSRDFRLVETKRDMEYRGRLSQSAVGTQIVAVADILCTAKSLLKSLADFELAVVPRAKKLLAQMDGDLLAISAANKYYVLRLYVHAARNMLTDISQKIKACRQKAKLDKMIAHNTQRLKEASEASSHETPVKPKAKREMRYAKKRNFRPDSE